MKKLNILATAIMGLSIAGCAGSIRDNSSLYSVHQPVVERNNYAIDINLSSQDGITGSEQKRLSEWMNALGLGYGDRVSLDFGSSGNNILAQQNVSDLAAGRGLLLQDQAPLTAGIIPAGSVRVIVSRSTASVPSCPNWDTKTASNLNGGNHSNYGCAINSTLAAMIADPEDLVRGVNKNGGDPTNGKKAIEAFNDRPATAGTGGPGGAGGAGGAGGGTGGQ